MSEVNSTRSRKPAKPKKPYPTFPLTAHPAGYWCKKIRGKIHYFGRWEDPDGALTLYNQQKDALHSGRIPREEQNALTIKILCNLFLKHKKDRVASSELSPRTLLDCKAACRVLMTALGSRRLISDIGVDDFAKIRKELTAKWGPIRVGNVIQRIRTLFKYGYDGGLIVNELRYGQEFKRPSKKTIRLERASKPPNLFTAGEIKTLVDAADDQIKAMILLGINCGFGNSDCGNIPLTALDLQGGWINYPRPKMGIPRRCALWFETVQALRTVLENRGEVKGEAAALVFVTKYGNGWAKDIADSPITKEMRKLLDRLGVNGHRNFYALRHTFRTVADECKDQPAINYVMGHDPGDMAGHYREKISDERLLAVADHVRSWLFAKQEGGANV